MVVNTQKTRRETTKGELQEKEQKIQNKIEVASRENNSLLVA